MGLRCSLHSTLPGCALGLQAFLVVAPHFWNNLPGDASGLELLAPGASTVRVDARPPPPSYPMLLFYLPFLRPPFFSFLFPPGDTFSVSPLPPPPFPILEGSTELRLLGLHSGRWGEADRFWRFMQVSVILIAEDVLTSCKTKTKQGFGCSQSINGS